MKAVAAIKPGDPDAIREGYANGTRHLQLSNGMLCKMAVARSAPMENRVLKTSMTAILLASGLALTMAQASAMQAIVTQVDKNKDGTTTFHYSIEVDKGETLVPGEGSKTGDFVTIYNFYGFVEGSAKSPPGWTFSSEEFGRTPSANGYPLVLPLDVPNTPNLTWTTAKPIAEGSRIDGFIATTHIGTIVSGEYAAQVTRETPVLSAVGAAIPARTRQAVIGTLPAPSFLANVK